MKNSIINTSFNPLTKKCNMTVIINGKNMIEAKAIVYSIMGATFDELKKHDISIDEFLEVYNLANKDEYNKSYIKLGLNDNDICKAHIKLPSNNIEARATCYAMIDSLFIELSDKIGLSLNEYYKFTNIDKE